MNSNDPSSMSELQAKRIADLEGELRIATAAQKLTSTQRNEADAQLVAVRKELETVLNAKKNAEAAKYVAENNRLKITGEYLKMVEEIMALEDSISDMSDDDADSSANEDEDERMDFETGEGESLEEDGGNLNGFDFRSSVGPQISQKSTSIGLKPQPVSRPAATSNTKTLEKVVDIKQEQFDFPLGAEPLTSSNFNFRSTVPTGLSFESSPSSYGPSLIPASGPASTAAAKSSFELSQPWGKTDSARGMSTFSEIGALTQASLGQGKIKEEEDAATKKMKNPYEQLPGSNKVFTGVKDDTRIDQGSRGVLKIAGDTEMTDGCISTNQTKSGKSWFRPFDADYEIQMLKERIEGIRLEKAVFDQGWAQAEEDMAGDKGGIHIILKKLRRKIEQLKKSNENIAEIREGLEETHEELSKEKLRFEAEMEDERAAYFNLHGRLRDIEMEDLAEKCDELEADNSWLTQEKEDLKAELEELKAKVETQFGMFGGLM